jgi:radical SAM protein with 4Fe4S-binding SPASM domain
MQSKEKNDMKSRVFPDIKAPITVSVELTTACNQRCRHCYNFWRHESSPNHTLSIEMADAIIDDILKNEVFHVILTGGECMLNWDVLTHMMRRLKKTNTSYTMNSNLLRATPDKMEQLAELGLPHTLTSLNCHDPSINDMMVSRTGAFDKITQGIRAAANAGIRVSVNMIVTQRNKQHVYATGKLIHELGATNFFTTRMVPSESDHTEIENELQLSPAEQKLLILDESIRVKQDTGINIGSLIQYPVCFLEDVVKYKDYVGRGCSAGRKLLTVNANGETHACVHEMRSYGNVFKDGLANCWGSMNFWRNDSLIPSMCMECPWLQKCEGGCRVYTHQLNEMDMLASPKSALPSPDIFDKEFAPLLNTHRLVAPTRLRWRQENGFTLVSVRGALVHAVSDELASFLKARQSSGESFSVSDYAGPAEDLAMCLANWIIETEGGDTTEPVSTSIAAFADKGSPS